MAEVADAYSDRTVATPEPRNVEVLRSTEDPFDVDPKENSLEKTGRMDDILKGRIAAAFLICAYIILAACTAAIPPVDPYDQSGNPAEAVVNSGDTSWLLTCAALVLLMTPGLAFFYGGMVNHRNVISTMYQSYIGMGIITLLWVLLGYSLAFGSDGGSGIIGNPRDYYMYTNVGALPHPLLASTVPNTVFSMFQLMFAMITPILISGALAERINFNAWMIFISIWHLVVYCPLAHMVWHPQGILYKWGVLDFAGGTVVEMSSGFASLAGALFLGPRANREAAPANVPFVLLGTGLLWFGWLGFNAGSALTAGSLACQAFATTTVCGAAGMMTWLLLDKLMGKPASAVGACNGCVVGLVAITPSCGYVTVGGAMCIGFLACAAGYSLGTFMRELKTVDDSLDVVTVHGVGGLVGFLSIGIFGSIHVNPAGKDGLVYGEGITLAKHIAVVLCLIPCVIISSYCVFFVTNLIVPLRVSAEDEEVGLDVSMHNESYSEPHRIKERIVENRGGYMMA